MKKIVLVFLLLIGINHHSNAQLNYGVKAGINYNSDSFEDASENVFKGAEGKNWIPRRDYGLRAKITSIGTLHQTRTDLY